MTDRAALREKIAVLLRRQVCDRHDMDPDRYGFASLDIEQQAVYLRDAEPIFALIEPLVEAATMMLDEAKNDVTGEYSSPAIRALRAALDQEPEREEEL